MITALHYRLMQRQTSADSQSFPFVCSDKAHPPHVRSRSLAHPPSSSLNNSRGFKWDSFWPASTLYAHHSHRDLGGGDSLAAELIDKLTTFLRRDGGEKNPLQLPRLRPSGSLSCLIESAGFTLLISDPPSLTSAVRALVPAVGAVGDPVAQLAHGDAHLRVQAAVLVDGTLVHLAVCAWRTGPNTLQKTRM